MTELWRALVESHLVHAIVQGVLVLDQTMLPEEGLPQGAAGGDGVDGGMGVGGAAGLRGPATAGGRSKSSVLRAPGSRHPGSQPGMDAARPQHPPGSLPLAPASPGAHG